MASEREETVSAISIHSSLRKNECSCARSRRIDGVTILVSQILRPARRAAQTRSAVGQPDLCVSRAWDDDIQHHSPPVPAPGGANFATRCLDPTRGMIKPGRQ